MGQQGRAGRGAARQGSARRGREDSVGGGGKCSNMQDLTRNDKHVRAAQGKREKVEWGLQGSAEPCEEGQSLVEVGIGGQGRVGSAIREKRRKGNAGKGRAAQCRTRQAKVGQCKARVRRAKTGKAK